MSNFTVYTPQQILFRWSTQEEWDVWFVWGRGEMRAGFWWGNQRERDRIEDLDVDGRYY